MEVNLRAGFVQGRSVLPREFEKEDDSSPSPEVRGCASDRDEEI